MFASSSVAGHRAMKVRGTSFAVLHQSGSVYQAPHGPKGGEGAAGAFYKDLPLIVEGIGHPKGDEAAAAVRELAVVMDRFAVTQDVAHPQP
jgi:hypothetical protein